VLSCKDVSELVARSRVSALTFRQRIGLRLHLLMCKACSRVMMQMKFLHRAALLVHEQSHLPSLSSSARDRLRETIERNKE
jgi:hypothetical protein